MLDIAVHWIYNTVDRKIFAEFNFHFLNFSAFNFRHQALFYIVSIARLIFATRASGENYLMAKNFPIYRNNIHISDITVAISIVGCTF